MIFFLSNRDSLFYQIEFLSERHAILRGNEQIKNTIEITSACNVGILMQ